MAQSGFTPIKLYLSTTAAATPTAANLEPGELALNNNDGKLFYEDSSGVVQVIATKAGASGDVVGPASATDNAVARYDGTTGKIIQNSAVTIGDTGNVAGVGTLSASGQLTLTNASDYNVYASGAGGNYFAGNVGIGIAPSYALDVDISFSTDRAFRIYNADTVLNDAELVHTILFTQNDASSPNGGNAWIKTFAVGSLGNLSMAFAVGGSNAPVERLRINGSTGVISLGAAVGSESLRVTPVASAVNYFEVQGAITSGVPIFRATGSDTNVPLTILTKGTGYFNFQSGGGTQFFVGHTASAVNYLQVTGGATGASTTLSAQGTDTNIDITLTPKGSGYVVVDAAYSPNLTLTDAATITWDTSTAGGQVATFTFVSSNRTMGAPTNLKNGGFYALAVIQNAGSNTLTWNSVFKWAAGTAPTLSTAAGAKDYFTFRSDGTNLYQQGISQAVA